MNDNLNETNIQNALIVGAAQTNIRPFLFFRALITFIFVKFSGTTTALAGSTDFNKRLGGLSRKGGLGIGFNLIF